MSNAAHRKDYLKTCPECGTEMMMTKSQKYCTIKCKEIHRNKSDPESSNFKNRSVASTAKIYERVCPMCETEHMMSRTQRFCSDDCKKEWAFKHRQIPSEIQYTKISGNWRKYLMRLIYSGGRRRDNLTVDILLRVLERQDYKCALSGEPMTCNLEVGKRFQTNASVDRIVAGGSYTEDNIQLVCQALNGFRRELSVEDFVGWCQKVASHSQITSGVSPPGLG